MSGQYELSRRFPRRRRAHQSAKDRRQEPGAFGTPLLKGVRRPPEGAPPADHKSKPPPRLSRESGSNHSLESWQNGGPDRGYR